jgi:hypothetical protein
VNLKSKKNIFLNIINAWYDQFGKEEVKKQILEGTKVGRAPPSAQLAVLPRKGNVLLLPLLGEMTLVYIYYVYSYIFLI